MVKFTINIHVLRPKLNSRRTKTARSVIGLSPDYIRNIVELEKMNVFKRILKLYLAQFKNN